jgi:hypothetical protein
MDSKVTRMDNDALMTRFLLGDLDPVDQQKIEERLIADPAYFEALSALEDDLILRWHRGELADEEQRLFADSYLSSPSRQARVAAGRQLIDAATRWEASASARWPLWSSLWQWRSSPWNAARFASAGALALLVLAMSVGLFAPDGAIRWLQRDEQQNTDAARGLTVAFTLAPVGDRGTTDSANLVRIPNEADEVWLQFEVADLSTADGLDAMVESLTGAIVAVGSPVRVTRTADSSHVTLTVPSRDLPDGDYVLRLRQASPAGDRITIATRTFRVMHL